MTEIVLAAGLAALALWLVLPSPHQAMARFEPAVVIKLPRFLAGRHGAAPLPLRLVAGAAVGIVTALVMGSDVGILAGGGVCVGLVVALGYLVPRTDTAGVERELPDALEFLAVCLEAGLPVSRAVETVAEVSPEATQQVLRQVHAHLKLGQAGPLAWQELRGHVVWGAVAVDIARAERSGTSLIGVLRMHAQDGRSERRERALKRARSIGVKSVLPLMTCFLPAFVLIGVVPIVLNLIRNFFG